MYDDLDNDNRVYLINCDIGNYRHWVKESTTAEKFFNNFDKLKVALNELSYIDHGYYGSTPDKELDDLCKNEQKYIQDFLSRGWLKTISDAAKIKTEKGRKNKIALFFDSLEPYKNRFAKETNELIERAKKEQPDYTLKRTSKSEKDLLFLRQTEKVLNNQDEIMSNIEHSSGNCAWFYKNSYLLNSLINEYIDIEIIYDITRLLLSDFNYQKASRYLHLKYNLNRKYLEKIYLASKRIVWSRRDFVALKNRYKNDPQFSNKYIISTHSTPCEKCQAHRGKIYNIKDAKIGVNFPPFCIHGCSSADFYIEGVSTLPKPLEYDEILFSKAHYLFEDEEYNEAAEYGLQAYKLKQDSPKYIKIVPDMLVKSNRLKEAVNILESFINNYNADSFIIHKYQKYNKRLERINKKSPSANKTSGDLI